MICLLRKRDRLHIHCKGSLNNNRGKGENSTAFLINRYVLIICSPGMANPLQCMVLGSTTF